VGILFSNKLLFTAASAEHSSAALLGPLAGLASKASDRGD